MFETITLYDNKVVTATSTPTATGTFKVTFTVEARKLRASDLGEESEIPMSDAIDIGVFAAPGPDDQVFGKPLVFERKTIPSGQTVFEFEVNEPPARVGIDPYNKLIDRAPRDNTMGL